MSEWQPIETYPRERDFPTACDWGPNALLFIPDGWVAPKSDYRILTGRLEANMWLGYSDDGSMSELRNAPTHWQPLPEPPK